MAFLLAEGASVGTVHRPNLRYAKTCAQPRSRSRIAFSLRRCGYEWIVYLHRRRGCHSGAKEAA